MKTWPVHSIKLVTFYNLAFKTFKSCIFVLCTENSLDFRETAPFSRTTSCPLDKKCDPQFAVCLQSELRHKMIQPDQNPFYVAKRFRGSRSLFGEKDSR